MLKLILPSGPPNKKYMSYMMWSFASTLLVSMEVAMSTHSMLDVIGTCDNAEYRTMNYIGKDIIGQLGGLFYMAKFSQKADKNPSTFLAYSNIIQQSSFVILSATPMFSPDMFLPLAGMSNVLTNISFTGYGAINAKCIQSIAADSNNTGEIYAKITTINTFGSTIGLFGGVALSALIPDPCTRTMIVPVIGLFRIYTFNQAVKNLI